MAFIIEPMKTEDLDTVVQIFWHAFEPLEADMVLPMVYPQGLQPDLMASLRAAFLDSLEKEGSSYAFCARDSATGEIASISRWNVNGHPPADAAALQKAYEIAAKQRSERLKVVGMNRRLQEAYHEVAFFTEAKVMSGCYPYVSLGLLATNPRYQGKGAGRALINQGLIQMADITNMPCFVLASRTARSLYERAHFKVKKVLPFDCRNYGGRSEGRHWAMVRAAPRSRDAQ
jgi:GNAT superfamily N-acetyltransferase